MHSLVDTCSCPDGGSNPQPWCIRMTLLPTELPGQGWIHLCCILFFVLVYFSLSLFLPKILFWRLENQFIFVSICMEHVSIPYFQRTYVVSFSACLSGPLKCFHCYSCASRPPLALPQEFLLPSSPEFVLDVSGSVVTALPHPTWTPCSPLPGLWLCCCCLLIYSLPSSQSHL